MQQNYNKKNKNLALLGQGKWKQALRSALLLIGFLVGFGMMGAYAQFTPAPEALKIDKKFIPDPGSDGKSGKIWLETYTTGQVEAIQTSVPTDFVLVLDVSNSMTMYNLNYEENGQTYSVTRMRALQKTVRGFIDQIKEDSENNEGCEHRVAVVAFSNQSNTQLISTEEPVLLGDNTTFSTLDLQDALVSVNSNNWDQRLGTELTGGSGDTPINDNTAWNAGNILGANHSGTKMDGGLLAALGVLNARSSSGGGGEYFTVPETQIQMPRNMVVVFFTDGYPGVSSHPSTSYWSNSGDHLTISDNSCLYASQIKTISINNPNGGSPTKPTVYSIGCTEDAAPEDEYQTNFLRNRYYTGKECFNGLLHFISSDYDQTLTSWQNNTRIEGSIEDNTFHNDGYYFKATNANELANAFATIGASHGGTTVDLGSSTIVQDVISASFKLPGWADISDIKVYAPMLKTITDGKYVFYDSIPNGGFLPLDITTGRIPRSSTTDTINCNEINSELVITIGGENDKTINLTHFDFSHYFCGPILDEGVLTGYRGRKLTIVIPIEIEEGIWGDGISTNGELSFVTPDGTLNPKYQFPLPTTNVLSDVWTEIVTEEPAGFNADAIDSPEDLAWFISLVNGRCNYAKNNTIASNTSLNGTLTADIDMSAHNWVPIGSGYQCDENNNYVTDEHGDKIKLAYEGVFNGNGHVITGLKNNASKYFKKASGTFVGVVVFPGMFANVKGNGTATQEATKGVVKNVFVLDSDFRGKYHNEYYIHHGIIADTLTNGLIYNCEAAGKITCNNDKPSDDMHLIYGGLVGLNDGGVVHSSMAMATLTGYSLGGMVGEMKNGATLANSFTNGVFNYLGSTNGLVWDQTEDPEGLFRYVGGLVGQNDGTVNNCYVRFERSNDFGGQSNAIQFGQLVGTNSGSVQYCYTPWDNQRALVANGEAASNCLTYSYPTMPSSIRWSRSNDNMVGGSIEQRTYIINEVPTTVSVWVGGTAMVDKLNDQRGTYTKWKRTTAGNYSTGAGNINGDYPVLKIDGFTCLGSTDGIAIDYAASLDDMLERHNTGAMNDNTKLPGTGSGYTPVDPQHPSTHDYHVSQAVNKKQSDFIYGGAINLYGNDNTSKGTSTVAKTMVYIDENTSLLQSTNDAIDAYTGQTMRDYNSNSNIQSGNRWHNVSSSIRNSVFGWSYGHSAEHNFESDPCGLWLDGSNPDQALFPTDMQSVSPFDFYCFFEPEYHWINFKRKGDSHWHMDDYTNNIEYYYNQPNGDFTDFTPVEDNETQFIPGKGYLLALHTEYFQWGDENMHLWTESESAKKDRTFLQNRGMLNNGTISIPVTAEAPEWTGLKGYNLLGNPYQSYLDFDKFVNATENANLWNGSNYSQTYAVFDPSDVETNGTGAKGGKYLQYKSGSSDGSNTASQYINMHQGFFIQVGQNGTAHFTNTMRTNDATPNFRGARPAYPLINFTLTDNEGQADIAVLEVGRPENDGAIKLRVGSATGRISLRHDDTDFGILFRDMTEGSQPLRFETQEDGTFTLSWNTANANFSSLTLVDNITGVNYDMLTHDSYEFEGRASDYKSRFKILIGEFTDVEENEETVTNNFAFFDGSEWVVNGQGQLTVADVMGRTVYTGNLTNDQNRVSLNGLSQGVYLMQVRNANGTMVQKIVVR